LRYLHPVAAYRRAPDDSARRTGILPYFEESQLSDFVSTLDLGNVERIAIPGIDVPGPTRSLLSARTFNDAGMMAHDSSTRRG